MNTEELNNQFNEFNSELAKLTEIFQSKMQGVFNEMMQQFFIETPRCQAITWTQYTPYFNDGEECTFSVNDIYFVENGFDPDERMSPYDYEYTDEESGIKTINVGAQHGDIEYYRNAALKYDEGSNNYEYYLDRADKIEKTLAEDNDGTLERCNMMKNVINSNEDLMRALFGDHCAVYLTRDGSIVDEYSHE
jgi:hypothetical protein